MVSVSKKKIGGNHAFFRDNKVQFEKKKKTLYIALHFTAFRIIVANISIKTKKQKNAGLPLMLFLDFNSLC